MDNPSFINCRRYQTKNAAFIEISQAHRVHQVCSYINVRSISPTKKYYLNIVTAALITRYYICLVISIAINADIALYYIVPFMHLVHGE